jgi:hypothetical protein
VHAVISGVVMEPGVNRPVADAEITVAEFVFQPYKYTEVAKGKLSRNVDRGSSQTLAPKLGS